MKTQCPNCKARFNVDDKFAGKQAKCPKCTKPFVIEMFVEKAVSTPEEVSHIKPADSTTRTSHPIAPPLMIHRSSSGSPPEEAGVNTTEPTKPPVESEPPAEPVAKNVAPAVPDAESPEPVKIPATVKPRVETTIERITAEAAMPDDSLPQQEMPAESESPTQTTTDSEEAAEAPAGSSDEESSVEKESQSEIEAEEQAQPVSAAEKTESEKASVNVPAEKQAAAEVSRKSLSKALFVWGWAVVRIVTGALAAAGLMAATGKIEGLPAGLTPMAIFAGADVFLVLSVLTELTLFYKMWAGIRDRQTSITPGKAVGLLFIPVFNIYWALCIVIGFPEDYNAYLQRRAIKAKELSITAYMIYAFSFMVSMLFITVPMLGMFAALDYIDRAFTGYAAISWGLLIFAAAVGIVHFITYIPVAIKTCNAISALPAR